MGIEPRLRWLRSKPVGKAILNIGFVGKHILLHQVLVSRNPQSLVVGLDLNVGQVLNLAIPQTVVANALALPFAERVYDSVVMGEVIEHVWDGCSLLLEIRRILKKGGKLYLSTPNPYATLRWARYWLLSRDVRSLAGMQRFLGDPDHKLLWEPISLMHLLRDVGFEVVECFTAGHRIPIVSRWIPRLSTIDISFFPFSRLGNNLCIAAKKRGG